MKKKRSHANPARDGYYTASAQKDPLTALPNTAASMAPTDAAMQLTGNSLYADADPQGSWTGVPRDGGMPVQDVDDL